LGSQSVSPFAHHANGLHFILAKGVKLVKDRCPASTFSFCVTVSYGATGPYWAWCGNASCSGSQYDLSASSTIVMTKSGKNMDKKLQQLWYPNPGNPAWVYITMTKDFAATKTAKFTQYSTACYVAYPSDCFSATVGIMSGG
jgi:hypothetical protein